jgi:(p)ppGpp synthase/HD superfamily hydrolase
MQDRARTFAVIAHGDQIYGEGQPYERHLAAVVEVIRGWTDDAALISAAWLHDTLEDTQTSFDDLANQFSVRVARLVWAVTAEGDVRAEKMAAIYRKIADCPDAALVKLADRVANVEAAPAGSNHSRRYIGERQAFESAVRSFVPADAWDRLDRAY